jgi:hypothetical protein
MYLEVHNERIARLQIDWCGNQVVSSGMCSVQIEEALPGLQ